MDNGSVRFIRNIKKMLIKDFKLHGKEFFKYFRISPRNFEDLLRMVGPIIARESKFCCPAEAAERLCVSFRRLVTKESQATIKV